MRHDNTQIASLGVWDEGGSACGGGKVMQETMIYDDEAKVTTTKKKQKNCHMQTKTRLPKKIV